MHYLFLGLASLILSTSSSSSSRLKLAIECALVNIFPAYASRIFEVGMPLPVCCKIRSRRVDTSNVSGKSGMVTTVPSSFHSGFEGSVGSCIRNDIGCYGASLLVTLRLTNMCRVAHRVHVDPVCFWIILTTGQLGDLLALGRRHVIAFHLIRAPNCACLWC